MLSFGYLSEVTAARNFPITNLLLLVGMVCERIQSFELEVLPVWFRKGRRKPAELAQRLRGWWV